MAHVSETHRHVAVFAFPVSSHHSVLLCLSRRLAEWAPEMEFSFFSTARSNASLSSWPAVPNLKTYDLWDGLPEGRAALGSVQEEIEMFLRATPGSMREALRALPAVTCILSDAFLWNAGPLAEEMGVPWIAFWSSNACSLTAHISTDLIRTTIGTEPNEVAARLDEPLDFIPGFSMCRVRDLPEGIAFGPLDFLLFKFLHRMGQEVPARATAVLLNTVEGMESAPVLHHLSATLKRCLPVGPLTLLAPPQPASDSDPHRCLPWLDAQLHGHGPASVAYVGFGTVFMPSPSELADLAEGLEASRLLFLWSLKDKMWAHLPAGFLERTKDRGLVVPWTPQTRVLGHAAVGAFVNHCGWNSFLESIAAGVPIVYRPFLADHRLNARLASEVLGVGIQVTGGVLTRDGVMDGLDRILRKDEGKKMRERMASVKLLATNAVGESGSSTENLRTALHIINGW